MKILIIILVVLFTSDNIQPQTISSPDSKLNLFVSTNAKGQVTYNLSWDKTEVIKTSTLGIELVDQPHLMDGFVITSEDTNTFYEEWSPVWGEVNTIINHYRELKINLNQASTGRDIIIRFRIFDDGIGFRYEFPVQGNLKYFTVGEEKSQFALTGDHKTFWLPGDYDSQEYTYTTSKLSEVDASKGRNVVEIGVKAVGESNVVQTPLMLKTKDGLYLNIHEAALLDYPAYYMSINQKNFVLTSHLAPDAVGNKAYMQTPCKTPWRTFIISDNAEDILASKLILNLNEPTKFEDVSWIKPLKYIGIWWGMHVGTMTWNYSDENNIRLKDTDWSKLTPNGKHGATTENTKKYIDFAASHGIEGVLVEGWNVGWEDWFGQWKEEVFDFVTPYPDYDVSELQRYAEEKSVKLIMHHETSSSVTNYERRLDKAFMFMKKHGYDAVKTGYVGKIIPRGEHHDGQWMINHYTRVLEKAAEYRITIDSHESVRPTGLHRTYPNWLAAEAARGNEFNAWSSGNPPEHETILPFTRLMGGPMDYTPGIFQIKMNYYDQKKVTEQVHTTLAKQLALYVTMYSPLQMAADLIENYEKHPDVFQFIKDVPVDWADTKILDAEPGDYIVIARKDKNSSDWFFGAITDEESRIFKVKLDFLDRDKKYIAEIYRDGDEADWLNNPQEYRIEKKNVNNSLTLDIKLAPGGGQAIRFKIVED